MGRNKFITVLVAIGGIIMIVVMSFATALFFYRAEYVRNKDNFDISASPYSDEVTVMSYNIRCWAIEDIFSRSWYYRADYVRQVIASYAPDIIGFQEVMQMHEKYLNEHLVGYDKVFAYRATSGIFNEAVGIAYRTDRFEKLDEGKFWLSYTPEVPSKDFGSKENRLAVYAVLKEKSTGKTFTFFSAHLDYQDDEIREKQMRIMLEEMDKLDGAKIFVGDFNGFDDTGMYKDAIKAGYLDAYEAATEKIGDKEPTYQKYGEDSDYRRIDYIFVSNSITVNSFIKDSTVFGKTYPSDHFPIVSKIIL